MNIRHIILTLSLLACAAVAQAQVYAQLKIWDSHSRYPKINEIEFQGADSTLATYDAIYGHGAMWESDYVGFRIYMDHRQSIDLYGKRKAQMELDRTNFYSTREDQASGLGADILWAGQSVAAGSFRGWTGTAPCYVDTVEARGQRIVKAGPDTTIVEVWDRQWQYRGHVINMKQTYTMLAHHRDVQVDVQLEGCPDNLTFCTGAQKLEMDNEGHMPRKGGLVASWGRNVPDKGCPDLIEGVGIGVYVPSEYLVEKREDAFNYLCLLHPVNGHIRYHLAVCATMQEEGGFHASKEWFKWLDQWASSLASAAK